MIKRILAVLSAVFVLSLAVGCAQTSSESADTAMETSSDMPMADAMEITVEKAKELGAMAVAMEKEPDRIPEILEEHGMTSENVEAMLVQIAADAELTEAYEAARAEASASH